MTEEFNRARLTKMASRYIDRLEQRVRELEEQIEERDALVGETNTVVVQYGHKNRPLPEFSTVGFSGALLDDLNAQPDFSVQVIGSKGNGGVAKPGDLQIMGSDRVIVVPQSSNLVTVRLA